MKYTKAEMEINEFDVEDIIRTSDDFSSSVFEDSGEDDL